MNPLWKAKQILAEDGWAKHRLQNSDGEVCAIGAINKAISGTAFTYYEPALEFDDDAHDAARNDFYRAVDLLSATIRELYDENWTSIPSFNDHHSTTRDMIYHAFAHAAAEWDLTNESGSQE